MINLSVTSSEVLLEDSLAELSGTIRLHMLIILSKILPLYVLVAAGYLGTKALKIRKEEFARLLIYMVTPVIVFDGVSKAPLESSYFVLPILFGVVCSILCFSTLALSKHLNFESTEPNILAFAAGNANSGYFAIPVGAALFGPEAVTPIILCSFGFILFENTIGFYIVARGNSSTTESLRRVLRLPTVYTFLLGLLLNVSGEKIPPQVQDVFFQVRGAYSVLGMMLIGMAIADAGRLALDLRFTFVALTAKFLIWPIVISAVLFATGQIGSGNFFDPALTKVIFFMATLPLAANTVAVAALLDAHPEKAAGAVLVSTLLALAIVPWLNS